MRIGRGRRDGVGDGFVKRGTSRMMFRGFGGGFVALRSATIADKHDTEVTGNEVQKRRRFSLYDLVEKILARYERLN